MTTVLLRLTGPMQSYGTSSHWEDHGTRLRPTKSAVIGLVANALGLPHDAPLHHLTRMTFAVRTDRPGRTMRDQQTAGGGHFPPADENTPHSASSYYAPRDPSSSPDGTLRPSQRRRGLHPILITKHYIEDAGFLAGLSTDDATLAATIDDALRRPARVLFLGRHCCPPAHTIAHGTTPHGPGQWPGRIPLLPEATVTEPTVWTDAQPTAPGAWPSPENPVRFSTRTHTTLFLQTSTVQPPAPEPTR
ncbi:type I-E CRISPR-associated protein Cas5/CasD [Streptomyces anthocyanicus]|uniref:type I-E CRISPR-associated protein Cas5/CasD n=1 Tax=Streptomyces anthocyanicus TaxID=68174 RepID=UPI00381D5A1D